MSSEALLFLQTVFAGKLEELYILIWTLPDKKSYWFLDVQAASEHIEFLSQKDVYVGTGLSTCDYGPSLRCKSDEIAGLVGIFADIDFRSDAHTKTALPSTVDDALSLFPADLPPTFVIHTGNGIHAWWLFREPWIFQDAEDRNKAASLLKRWSAMVSDAGRMKGWGIDRLGDLARILRVPGTLNRKDPCELKPVTILSHTDRRYDASDLVEFLDDFGVGDDNEEQCAKQRSAQQFQDKPLHINLNATIPQDRLDRWTRSDERFKNTWFRQRSDLRDHSQSGYDLALARFGFGAGLQEQEIVDMIVHHRQMHRQKPRTVLDYFHRTLSKAAEPSESGGRFKTIPCPVTEVIAAETPTTPNLSKSPESDREKLDLCKEISSAFGIDLLRLVKMSGDEPFYRMDLVEGSVSFSSVGKLINQSAVRTAIAGRVGRLIPPFKQTVWRVLAQALLDACIVEDGGEELDFRGAARLQIRQYLAETTFIPSIEGQAQQDIRKPIVRDDQIAVCSSDLLVYINKTRTPSISIKAVVGMLSAVGAKHERIRGKRFNEQSRWMLPLNDFDPADYDSSSPVGATERD